MGVGADVGQRFSLRGRRTLALVAATGRPPGRRLPALRRSDRIRANGPPGVPLRDRRAHPMGGMLWGGLLALSTREDTAFAPGSEDRLAELGELVGMAVAGPPRAPRSGPGSRATCSPACSNRRTFEEHLVVEVERAHLHERQVSLVLFDVDGFGDLNDRIGHAGVTRS